MPRIYIQFSGLDRIGTQCGTIASKIDDIRSDLKGTIKKLDWDVRYESDIDGTADRIAKKLDGYEDALKKYKKFIEDAHRKYVKLDEYDSEKTGLLEALKGGISTYIEDWKTGAEIIKTSISNCASAIAEDYESKGASYRFVNGALGVAKMIGGTATLVASIAGTGITAGMSAPATVLIGTYGANTAISGLSDLINSITGNVDDIGNVNLLKSSFEGVGGQVGEWMGNREFGESVGNAVYTVGEIATIVVSLENLSGQIKQAHSAAGTLGESVSKTKVMLGEASKEIPDALNQLGAIVTKTPISEIPYRMSQLTHSIPAINKVMSDISLIQKGVETGDTLINKGIDVVNTLAGCETIEPFNIDLNGAPAIIKGVLDGVDKIEGIEKDTKKIKGAFDTIFIVGMDGVFDTLPLSDI